MSDDEAKFISERAATKLLSISHSKLRDLRESGEGPPHYDFAQKSIRYDRKEVIELRDEH